MKRDEWAVVAAAVLYFFFVSEDNVTHDMFASHDIVPRLDSCWFLTCGRAWMNGLIPYVDFADSKGPLLWLLYGIGYLLSPKNYVGVYAVSQVFVCITALYLLRLTRLFVSSRRASLVLTLLTIPLLFQPVVHIETRSEDYILTFMCIAFYHLFRVIYADDVTPKRSAVASLVTGICIGAILMIKFSHVTLLTVPVLVFCWHVWRTERRLLSAVLLMAAGCVLAVGPFVAWFAWKGHLWDFVNEYFFVTYETINNVREKFHHIDYVLFPPLLIYVGMLTVWTLSAASWLKTYRWLPVVTLLVYLLPIVYYSRLYYFNVCSVLLPFGMITVYELRRREVRRLMWGAAVVVALLCMLPCNLPYRTGYFYSRGLTPLRAVSHDYACMLATRDKPRIIYWRAFDCGYEVMAEGLPACKYYASQGGMTARMSFEQDEAVRRRAADFVFVYTFDHERLRIIEEEIGYHRCPRVEGGHFILFSREPWQE